MYDWVTILYSRTGLNPVDQSTLIKNKLKKSNSIP